MIRSAHTVFCPPAFTDDELARIFSAAAGQTLHFGPKTGTVPRAERSGGLSPLSGALVAYARGEDWRSALTVSVRRFYQVLAFTRDNCCTERVLTFQREGLSLRQLARLFAVSVPKIQSLLAGSVSVSESPCQSDSVPKEA